jgi:site-specific DNA recombinase
MSAQLRKRVVSPAQRNRAVVYCRFSTSDQDERTSFARQETNCASLADQHGLEIIHTYRDAARGGDEHDRPDYNAMMAAARRGEFDFVLADESSRVWRPEGGELLDFVAELTSNDQHLITAKDGLDTRDESSILLVPIHGAVNRSERRKIAARTYGTLRELAKMGKCAGGRVYGYQTRRGQDGYAEWAIKEDEAEVVRFIFETYASQRITIRGIAARLNEKCVAPPRGENWSDRTLNKMMRNAMYTGVLRWGRQQWRKKFKATRRTPKAREDFVEISKPELRIVPESLWKRVQERRDGTPRPPKDKRRRGGRAPKHLLSGIIVCGVCGGGFGLRDGHRYCCFRRRTGGAAACSNSHNVHRELAEEKILGGVHQLLTSPEMLSAAREAMLEHVAGIKRQMLGGGNASKVRAELVVVEKQLASAAQKIIELDLGASAAVAEQIKKLEGRRAALARELETAKDRRLDALPDEIPDALARCAAEVEKLGQLAETGDERVVRRAQADLRTLLGDTIRLEPHVGGYLVARLELQKRAIPLISGERVKKGLYVPSVSAL